MCVCVCEHVEVDTCMVCADNSDREFPYKTAIKATYAVVGVLWTKLMQKRIITATTTIRLLQPDTQIYNCSFIRLCEAV